MICTWIVYEQEHHWQQGLLGCVKQSLPQEHDVLRFQHVQRYEEVDRALVTQPEAVVFWELRNHDAKQIALIGRLAEQHVVQILALPSEVVWRSHAAVQMSVLYQELGISAVIQTYAELPLVCRLARRHWERIPGQELSYAKTVWQSLPWRDE